QAVERGDFALGLSGVEDTPARRARHAATLPYFEFREVLAVRPEEAARIHGLIDLRGRRVATLGATIAYDLLVRARDSTGLIPVSYDDDVHPYGDLGTGPVVQAIAYLPSLARAAAVTALVSVLSMMLAVLVGLALASGRLYGSSWLRALTTVYIEVIRGTPLLLQLFVIYYGLAGVIR